MEQVYKSLFIKRFTELSEKHPEYSIGECLYSVFRRECLRVKPQGVNTSWLLNIKDKELYGASEHAINMEDYE